MSSYIFAIGSIALIYALLALGLNLQWGHTGLINFGHVGFYAIGAYASALVVQAGAPIYVGIIVGTLLAGLGAYPIGWLTLRLKEDYLAIVTIGFSEIIRIILLNSKWSGGAAGLAGVPRLFVSAGRELSQLLWFALMFALVIITIMFMRRLSASPFGRVLRAIRADDVAIESLGKNASQFKTVSLVIGAGLAGLAGSLYAHWVGFVAPDQFVPLITFYIWTGIILGGSSHLGSVVGTMILVTLFEGTRFLSDFGLPIDSTKLAYVRFIVVGIVMIRFLQVRPAGLWPHRHARPVWARAAGEEVAPRAER